MEGYGCVLVSEIVVFYGISFTIWETLHGSATTCLKNLSWIKLPTCPEGSSWNPVQPQMQPESVHHVFPFLTLPSTYPFSCLPTSGRRQYQLSLQCLTNQGHMSVIWALSQTCVGGVLLPRFTLHTPTVYPTLYTYLPHSQLLHLTCVLWLPWLVQCHMLPQL